MAEDVNKYKALLESRLAELNQRMQTLEHELDAPVSRDSSEQAIEREDDETQEDLGVAALEGPA